MIPNDDKRINPFNVVKQYKGSINLYNFVDNSPINLYDTLGLWSCPNPGKVYTRFCKCLKDIPYFKAGARALEIGWCNGCSVNCLSHCLLGSGVSNPVACEKACKKEHATCVTRGGIPTCSFKFSIPY